MQNFEVTMRTATEVHLSWDPPAKIGVAYYMVRRKIAVATFLVSVQNFLSLRITVLSCMKLK